MPGQPAQAPLTPGGFYSPATPVQQAQAQPRPPMGYAPPPQNPAMFAGQQQPQQIPPAVQQQRMQAYPAPMKQVGMPGAPQVNPGQFRGPPVEEAVQPPPPKKKRKPTKKQQQKEAELAAAAAAQQQQNAAAAAQAQQQQQQFYNDRMMHPAAMTPAMQMMGHSGYPPSAAYPPTQPGMPAVPPQYPGYPQGAAQQQQLQQQQQQALWHQQMQQRMMYQQQHGQPVGGPPAQPWPGQRGPPVPYPTPMDGVQCGPASVHPTVSQRTSGSGEYSRDGTSPATPHQFNPGSHQGMMMLLSAIVFTCLVPVSTCLFDVDYYFWSIFAVRDDIQRKLL
ncbi:unnamed protein product [Cylicostephanus goldi]|uniref:Uncharacterized protein n=1 Tax=Cylicostephanus goldi TaxID=71465 RepID=A0A3P6S279_CYLGO|nr:unnamed protein product [Cylicostephanus goldi]